jgi:hypothetical protein
MVHATLRLLAAAEKPHGGGHGGREMEELGGGDRGLVDLRLEGERKGGARQCSGGSPGRLKAARRRRWWSAPSENWKDERKGARTLLGGRGAGQVTQARLQRSAGSGRGWAERPGAGAEARQVGGTVRVSGCPGPSARSKIASARS